jgi:hypothetical protein
MPAEQRMVQETDRYAERQEVNDQRDVWSPGLRAGFACHPGSPTPEQTGDNEKR